MFFHVQWQAPNCFSWNGRQHTCILSWIAFPKSSPGVCSVCCSIYCDMSDTCHLPGRVDPNRWSRVGDWLDTIDKWFYILAIWMKFFLKIFNSIGKDLHWPNSSKAQKISNSNDIFPSFEFPKKPGGLVGLRLVPGKLDSPQWHLWHLPLLRLYPSSRGSIENNTY